MICDHSEVLAYLGKAGATLTDAEAAAIQLIHEPCEAAVKALLDQTFEQATHVEFLPSMAGRRQRRDWPIDPDPDVSGDTVRFRTEGALSTDVLQLRHIPVLTTSLEVREDPGGYGGQSSGAFADATILTAGNDYYLDTDESSVSQTGLIYRVDGSWPAEPRSVKVTYLGGFTDEQIQRGLAGAIKLATLKTIAHNFKMAVHSAASGEIGPKTSERIGKYSYSVDGSAAAKASVSSGATIPEGVYKDLQPFRNFGRLFA